MAKSYVGPPPEGLCPLLRKIMERPLNSSLLGECRLSYGGEKLDFVLNEVSEIAVIGEPIKSGHKDAHKNAQGAYNRQV